MTAILSVREKSSQHDIQYKVEAKTLDKISMLQDKILHNNSHLNCSAHDDFLECKRYCDKEKVQQKINNIRDECESRYENLSKVNDNLRSKIKDMNGQLCDMRKVTSENEASLSEIEEAVERANVKRDEATMKVTSLQNHIEDIKADHEIKMKKEMYQIEENARYEAEEVISQNAERRQSEMKTQCATTMESISSLKRELEDENEKIKCLEKSETIDSLRDDIDRLNGGELL